MQIALNLKCKSSRAFVNIPTEINIQKAIWTLLGATDGL